MPEKENDKYIWQKIERIYINGLKLVSIINISGADGTPGAPAISIQSNVETLTFIKSSIGNISPASIGSIIITVNKGGVADTVTNYFCKWYKGTDSNIINSNLSSNKNIENGIFTLDIENMAIG